MMKKNRLTAAVLALTVAVLLFCSVSFLLAEADHDCRGENCAVCIQICRCENTLQMLAGVLFTVLSVAALSIFALILSSSLEETQRAVSLVSLKVKLSD